MKANKNKLFDKDWRCRRLDGRLELTCTHGVGHPSKKLHSGKWKEYHSVHGCDGCCNNEQFKETEKEIAKDQWMKFKKEHVNEDKTTNTKRSK